MRRCPWLIACALPLLLAGCATVGGMSENLAAVPSDRGVVLFSTGAAKTSLSFSTRLDLVQGSSLKRYNQVIINLDYPFTSDFPPEHGQARTLTLPQGEYYLMPAAVNPFFQTTKGAVYRFKVAGGQVTYIGNFFLADSAISWSDKKLQRDAELFRKKNPALAGKEIVPQKVEVAGDVSTFQTKGSIGGLP